jgi:hypothetical protein
MKKLIVKRVIWSILLTSLLLFSAYTIVGKPVTHNLYSNIEESDYDPLVDVEVTVEIKKIRSFDKFDWQVPALEKIDLTSDPDFYVKVFINNEEFVSDVWHNTKYIYDPQWSATLNVPDEEEFVDIKIQLWDWEVGMDKLCDISSDYNGIKDSRDIEITYDIKTGKWFGDDFISEEPVEFDLSGYGRLNGCDDGSIYQFDRDCELWFDIYQSDYDGDNLPYWTEVNVFGTDPKIDNTGEDADDDGVPIEWEHKWGSYFYYDWHDDTIELEWFYNPFVWEDHKNIDLDQDGIDNVEEYLTSQWGSDPFRKDLFVELDQMEDSPNGDKSILPEGSKELLRTVYDRQNIVYHLDDGCMGGSDIIPFDSESNYDDLKSIYWNYFLHGDEDNWRRGVFHYGLIVYFAPPGGFVFWGGVGPYLDSYVVSSHYADAKYVYPKTTYKRNIVYASAYMHECGHTLGIFHGNTPGCDDQRGKFPWQINFWKWRPYRSVMNYGFMYTMVDYSDGSRGKNDFDDWNRLDLTFFQRDRF